MDEDEGRLTKEEKAERSAMVTKDYQGIYPLYEVFYIDSIIYAAERCDDAFSRFDEAVATDGSHAAIFAMVQEALTHSAALSRFFWPPTKNKLCLARGENLRSAFAVDESSPLGQRKLRNALEHYDEYLDDFLLQDRVGNFFPSPIVDHHELADDALGNIFKLVDPDKGICVILGEKYEFDLIRDEVRRILELATTMDNGGSRLRPYRRTSGQC
ncbi:hypothetical protein [Sphingomonas sanguinis]|uniref:Uncharacterized protein n=1 Tax=Sphingomonas sanguinis TaxID=33051 RepID=A0A147HU04_9SPHN|nr:hypothetical protein [Sphingomonas sanguinis]KTT68335.1 hypothetical protein NS319_14370 [Sphingomonas sanguinis]